MLGFSVDGNLDFILSSHDRGTNGSPLCAQVMAEVHNRVRIVSWNKGLLPVVRPESRALFIPTYRAESYSCIGTRLSEYSKLLHVSRSKRAKRARFVTVRGLYSIISVCASCMRVITCRNGLCTIKPNGRAPSSRRFSASTA